MDITSPSYGLVVGSIPAGSANDRKGIKDTVTTVAVFFLFVTTNTNPFGSLSRA